MENHRSAEKPDSDGKTVAFKDGEGPRPDSSGGALLRAVI